MNHIFQHNGGIKSLSVFTEQDDGYIDYIWSLTDTSTWSNDDWWVGQVPFNTKRVRNIWKFNFYRHFTLACV